MIPRVDLEALRSTVSMHELVAPDVSLKRIGQYWQGLCCFHQERTPSFYIMPGDQRFRCFGCGATGDAIEYLKRAKGLDFHQAVAQLSSGRWWEPSCVSSETRPPVRRAAVSLLDVKPARIDSSQLESDRRDKGLTLDVKIRELWNSADARQIASFYLQSRGLMRSGALPAALRGHSRVLYSEPCGETKPIVEPSWRTWRALGTDRQWWKGTHKPAMLAAVTDANGQITALQRIWCERSFVAYDGEAGPHDARAQGLAARKKCLGHLGAGAVRLATAGPTLGLAEGVESAMAAALLFRIPVWATCGSGRLHSIALPDCVERILVFADCGEAGERAAERAMQAYGQSRDCSVVYPASGFGDFNDQLQGRAK